MPAEVVEYPQPALAVVSLRCPECKTLLVMDADGHFHHNSAIEGTDDCQRVRERHQLIVDSHGFFKLARVDRYADVAG